ncbi:molybdopterin cofactor-binding domain-containing protein [uncultured Croceicoccus sp.]|uniref:molybdopterin cofactor-binding domain-containing protein n=1 Tax=uncultured Croceicoccus sp. TaxID=1295329 RepID=UPI002635034E|nr:molybdopterin cofactor-binding domain-containing protein [uncultured Croceicoccus sp.]
MPTPPKPDPASRAGGGRARVTRRGLLIGAAAGGGLIAAWTFIPRDYPVPIPPGEGQRAFGSWIKLSRDGVVSIAVPVLEMGQGATTLLPRIAAQELGADWRQIAVEPAAISATYADPVLAAHWAQLWAGWFAGIADTPGDTLAKLHAQRETLMATADGTALAAYETPLREAAAGLRAVLSMAAAERWDVAFEECRAEGGFIIHGDKRVRFADLVDDAAGFEAPDPPLLNPTPASETAAPVFTGPQESYPRLDAPSKVDGSFPFAADIRLPGMLFAAIAHGPLPGARLTGFDHEAARRITGYEGRVVHDEWIAALARSTWAAEKAVKALAPRFAPTGELSEDIRIEAALQTALTKGEAVAVHETGDPVPLLDRPDAIAARYDIAPAWHGTLETASATARLADGRLELWIASQAPEQARRAAAGALGMGARDVVVYPVGAGGSFDARLDIRIAREAALIARAAGRPVQLSYSRWQEMLTEMPRAPVAAQVRAVPGRNGLIAAWQSRIATPAPARQMHDRLFARMAPAAAMAANDDAVDPPALFGAAPPYRIPAMRVEAVPAAIGLPVGRIRGNGDAACCFITESFMDEMAGAAGAEPLSYRVAMLGGDVRLAECLQGAAQIGEWDGGVAGSGQGIACWHMRDPAGRADGGGRIAAIVRARRGPMGAEVASIAAFCDIGRVVDLELALQQIEGGLLYGMGLALGSRASYARGLPREETMGALNLPPLSRAPEITVGFARNDFPPFDPGELGTVVIAPAIANALHAATGERFRRLPMVAEPLVPPPPMAAPTDAGAAEPGDGPPPVDPPEDSGADPALSNESIP